MPKIAETLGDVKVRSHTFRFVWPAQTDAMKIPERLQSVSRRQDDGLGDGGAAQLERPLALALAVMRFLPGGIEIE